MGQGTNVGIVQLLSMSFRQFQKPQQLRTYCFNLSTLYDNLTPQSFLASKCHYLLPDSLGNHHFHLIPRAQFNGSISHCHLTPTENTTTELLKGVKVLPSSIYFSKSRRREVYMTLQKDIFEKLVSRSYINPLYISNFSEPFDNFILFQGNP